MQATGIPTKFPVPWANAAGPSYIRAIPEASQIGIQAGAASLTDGFVPDNFTPAGSGGVPPFGQDANGILNQITQWLQWHEAGGPVPWDSAFSTKIGGYPAGAVVASATTAGLLWLSTTDNNTTNPDSAGAGWKALPLACGGREYYVDGGSVNALAISPAPALTALVDGYTFIVKPAFANTGAATLQVNALSAHAIVHPDGSALANGDIAVGTLMILTYVAASTSFQWVNAPWVVTRSANDNSNKPASTAYADRAAANALAAIDQFAGALYGLTMSNAGGTSTTQVTVSAGACRDSTNSTAINVASPMTKDLTLTWAAGTGQGGRLSATALAAGQTWHMFVLVNPSNGATDFGFDTSPTAPTMTAPSAAGFTEFRRIGAILLEASSTAIRQFTQIGDWFMLKTRSADYASTANGGSTAYYRAITVPVGIVVEALLLIQSTGTTDANPYICGVYNPAFGSTLPLSGSTQWGQIRRSTYYNYPGSWANYGYQVCTQFTDASAHVYTGCNDATDFFALGVLGWRDQRGRFYPDA